MRVGVGSHQRFLYSYSPPKKSLTNSSAVTSSPLAVVIMVSSLRNWVVLWIWRRKTREVRRRRAGQMSESGLPRVPRWCMYRRIRQKHKLTLHLGNGSICDRHSLSIFRRDLYVLLW